MTEKPLNFSKYYGYVSNAIQWIERSSDSYGGIEYGKDLVICVRGSLWVDRKPNAIICRSRIGYHLYITLYFFLIFLVFIFNYNSRKCKLGER